MLFALLKKKAVPLEKAEELLHTEEWRRKVTDRKSSDLHAGGTWKSGI